MPQTLVITGFGLNCEAETSEALHLANLPYECVHLNDLVAEPERLRRYGMVIFIGGFSFGDHIAAGRVLAIHIRKRLADPLAHFIEVGGLVLGICNGFQALCKIGLLPGIHATFNPEAEQLVTLTHNDSGVFRNDWVRLCVNPASPCVFTKGLTLLELPVRHGEGKFVTRSEQILKTLCNQGQIVYQYCDIQNLPTQSFPDNPNGSAMAIAGICDATGRVFGTMPHPEAFIRSEHHPHFARMRALEKPSLPPMGLKIFQNAARYFQER